MKTKLEGLDWPIQRLRDKLRLETKTSGTWPICKLRDQLEPQAKVEG